jgi:hypothetical protein
MALENTVTEEEPNKTDAEPSPAPGGKGTEDVRDLADQLRGRVDIFGKALGGVATVGVTAVGLAKIGDLFPVEGQWWWFGLAIAGFVSGAVAVVWIVTRLTKVSRPIYVRTDLDAMRAAREIDDDEHGLITPLFTETARLAGYKNLETYEERERALRRVSRWTGDSEVCQARAKLAEEIRQAVEHTRVRALLILVRRRATEAMTGFRSWVAYLLFIAGLVVFALGTDKITSEREDGIAIAKSCGEAREAGATAEELEGTACSGESADEDQPEQTGGQVRLSLAESALAALQTCGSAVTSGILGSADCAPLRRAAEELLRSTDTEP